MPSHFSRLSSFSGPGGTCIKWPRDPAAQQVFWIMLQRALLDGEEKNAANGHDPARPNPLAVRAPHETKV